MNLDFGIDQSREQHKNIGKTDRSLFKGIFREFSSFPREIFQNSIDSISLARKERFKTTGTFKFRRVELDLTPLPTKKMIDVYQCAIKTLEDRLPPKRANETTQNSLEESIIRLQNAIQVLERGKTEAIIMEDDGIGLDGTSRFMHNTGSELILNLDSTSKHDAGEAGSWGVGKKTAFVISNIFGVLYLNQYADKRRLIGQVRICSFMKDGQNHSPECYVGKTTKDANCDWIELTPNDPYFDLRSFANNGLTTIVPTSYLENDDLWLDKVIYTYIESYSHLLLNDDYTIEIIDEIEGVNVVLSRDTLGKYISNETNPLIESYDIDDGDVIDRMLLTEAIINSEPETEFQQALFYKPLDIKGDVLIKLYKTPREVSGARGLAFRFFRNGMMIRDHKIIQKGKKEGYCGTVEFSGKENGWESRFRNIESPSHDELNLNNADERNEIDGSFPDQKIFKQYFFAKIVRSINEKIEILEGIKFNTEKLSFSLPSGTNVGSESSGSSLMKPIFKETRKSNKVDTSTTIDKQDNDTGSGNLGGGNQGGGSDGGGGTTGTSTGGDGPTRGPSDGLFGGNVKAQILPIKSKLISRDELTHRYNIVVDNFDKSTCKKIEISQYSAAASSTKLLSFKIIRLSVNGEELKSNQWIVSKNSDNQISSYELQNSSLPESTTLELNLEVQEPRNTTSSFKITKI